MKLVCRDWKTIRLHSEVTAGIFPGIAVFGLPWEERYRDLSEGKKSMEQP